jgi:RNA polymerase sigma-70 factor (ECF subfamily)
MRYELIRQFYEANRQGLYTYALSLTGQSAAAEDAVHTAICKLLQRLLLPRSLKSYAYRCVRNAAIDEWRKYSARQDHVVDLATLPAEERDTWLCRDIEDMLFRMEADEREIIVLKAVEGLTFKEIAAIVGAGLNTVASRYRRGLEKLRNMLQEKQP